MKKNYPFSMQSMLSAKRQVYQFLFPLFFLATLFLSNKAQAYSKASETNSVLVTESANELTAHIWSTTAGGFDCDTDFISMFGSARLNNITTDEEITYHWSGPNDFVANTMNVSVTEPGTYTLKVTHNTTKETASTTWTLSPPKYPVASAGPNKILTAENPIVILEGTMAVGNRVSWSASDGGNIVSGDKTLNPIVDAPGTYTMVVSFISSRCTAEYTVNVTREEPAVIEAAYMGNGGINLRCSSSTPSAQGFAKVNGQGTNKNIAYNWLAPDGSTFATDIISITMGGDYIFTVTDTVRKISASITIPVSAPVYPTGSAGPDKKLTCKNGTVTLEGSGDQHTVQWFASDGGNIVSGSNTYTPVVDAPGTYRMVLYHYFNGCRAEYTVKVTRDEVPSISASGGILDPTAASVQLKGSSSAEGATYSWTGPNNFTSTEQNPTVTMAGTYTLTVTDPETGCTNEAQAVVKSDKNELIARIWTNHTGGFDCGTTSISLLGTAIFNNVTTDEGITFQWSGPNAFNANKKDIFVTEPGTYTLLVTHIASGATATASWTLSAPKVPIASAGPDKKLTTNNPTVMLEGTMEVGNRVIWEYSEGGNIVSGGRTLNPIVDAPGTYTMIVSFISSRCMAKYTVTVSREEELTVNATGGKLDCASASVQLTASSNTEGVTYNWTGPNGYTSTEQNPTVMVAGEYRVTVTNPESGLEATTSVVVTAVSAEMQVTNHMIDFNGQKRGLISSINTEAGPVAIMGRKRNADGSYEPENYAAIFDTQDPTGDDANLYTVDWAEALIINQYHNDYPDANQWGGELILDFSAIGPVTMESMKVVGMDLYEQMSWAYLYDADGKELNKVYLKPLGINSKQTIQFGNTRGVMKMKVVLDGRNGSNHLSGSAAIDDIKFQVEKTVENPCDVVAANITHMKAYPTSFSDNATLEFIVRETDNYSINLYDTQGMLVKQLKQGTARAGELTTVELNGRELKEGMYFAKLVSGKTSHTFKLILKR